MMRPAILRSDFNLRLFIDTNVLIDYLEDYDKQKAKSFIDLFKNSNFDNIELVTSDYVIWELYDYFRKDLYVKKMINELKWGFNRAQKGIKEFKDVDVEVMKGFGIEIGKMVDLLKKNGSQEAITIKYIMSENTEKFSEIIEQLLRSSKISYKDTMIVTSAYYTNSHVLVTIDEQFKGEGNRISELEEENKNLPKKISLKFKPPIDFSCEDIIKKNYKEWFEENNEQNKIGKVIKCYDKVNVIGVECLNDYIIKVGDYIYAVKFNADKDIIKYLFKIEEKCLRNYDTNEQISEGKKVTIKLLDYSPMGSNLENANIFLAEE